MIIMHNAKGFANKVTTKTNAVLTKVNMKACAIVAAIVASLNATAKEAGLEAYCDFDPNKTINNFMSVLFGLVFFAGVIFTGLGVITLGRTFMQMAGGDQVQPGSLIKGVVNLVFGVLLMGLPAILKTVTGEDPTNLNIF